MAVSIGDAILYFDGNTTNLDQAFERVNKDAKTKLQPVAQIIQNLGSDWQFAGRTASTAGQLSQDAGEQMEKAGQRAANAFHEARGSIDLLSDQIGVSLPRELKTFLAEMPGVQSALSGAFKATAILALAGFIADLTEKVTQFAIDTFILTAAMKENDAGFSKINQSIAAQVEQLRQLHDAYDLVGLEGSAKFATQIQQINTELVKGTASLAANRDSIDQLRKKYDELASSKENAILKALPGSKGLDTEFDQQLEAAEAALKLQEDTRRKLENDQKVYQQTRTNLEKEANVAILGEDRSAAAVRINAVAEFASAENQVWLQQQRFRIIASTGSYADLASLQAQFDQRQLDTQVTQLTKLRNNLDPSRSGYAAAVDQYNKQIAAIEDQSYAAREEAAGAFRQRLDEILKGSVGPDSGILKEIAPNPALLTNTTDAVTGLVKQFDLLNEIFSPTAETVDQIDSAFQALGITTNSLDLAGTSLEQARAISVLSDAAIAGTINMHDLAEAEIEYLRQQQAVIRASDLDTASKRRQTAAYQAQIDIITRKLDPAMRAHSQLAQSVANATGQAILAEAYAYGQGQATITQALRAISAAIIGEIAKQAEVKGADALAWGLWDLWHNPPAAASDFGAAALWFALAGGISAGAGAVAGSGGSDSGQSGIPGNLPPTQQTAATTAQPEPIQTVNVQRLATGGIATHRMLAMVGDDIGAGDAAEAIIPLGSSQARQMFADTFLPGLREAWRAVEPTPGPVDRFSVGGLMSRQTLALVGSGSSVADLTDQHLDDIADRVAARIQPGEVHNHYDNSSHLHAPKMTGVVDSRGLMKDMTRAAKRGGGRLTSSDSLRTRKV